MTGRWCGRATSSDRFHGCLYIQLGGFGVNSAPPALQVPKESYGTMAQHSLTALLASGVLTNSSVPSCGKKGVVVPPRPPSLKLLPASYKAAIGAEDTAGVAAALIAEGMVRVHLQAVMRLWCTSCLCCSGFCNCTAHLFV